MESVERETSQNLPESETGRKKESAGEKKKKGGRPRKLNGRSCVTGIRFTPAEYQTVQNKAKEAGRKPTVYIREAALKGGNVKALLSQEQMTLIRQLAGMANNLNQLTRKYHQAGIETGRIYFADLGKAIRNLMNQIQGGEAQKGGREK